MILLYVAILLQTTWLITKILKSMKKKIIYNNSIPFKGFAAITIFPFIFARKEYEPLGMRTIIHKNIHLKQQIELLIVFFYLWYGIEWIVRLIQYKSFQKAYRNISFEREAYDNEYDDEYLDVRKPYEWIHYLRG